MQETASSVQPSAPAVYGVETCASREREGEGVGGGSQKHTAKMLKSVSETCCF